MDLDIDLSISVTQEEAMQLASILGTKTEDLGETLAPVGEAALTEYVRMFLGQAVFTRGSDIHEYRLFLLIKHLFKNRIPYEQRISDLFQTTATKSRALVRSVMSKYQYELRAAIEDSLAEILAGCPDPDEGEDFEVSIFNDSLVKVMNRLLASMDGSLPPVVKKRGTVTTYLVRPSALRRLIEYLEVTPGE